MAQLNSKELTTLPVGRLGLIPLQSCRPLGEKVDKSGLYNGEKNASALN